MMCRQHKTLSHSEFEVARFIAPRPVKHPLEERMKTLLAIIAVAAVAILSVSAGNAEQKKAAPPKKCNELPFDQCLACAQQRGFDTRTAGRYCARG
jgi:hypothetical protein